jgi:cytochrome c5
MKKVFSCLAIVIFFMNATDAQAPVHHPEAFIASIQHDPKAGQKIYEHFCATCHAADPSIDLGAPRFRNLHDWQGRMQKGVTGLLTVTTVGINQMPPRGGCFECSDRLLKEAIIYMLPSKKRQQQPT